MHRPPPHFALASGGLIQLAIDGSGPEPPARLFQLAKQGNFEKCGIYRAKRGFAKSSLPGTRKSRLATMAMELQSRQSRGRSEIGGQLHSNLDGLADVARSLSG